MKKLLTIILTITLAFTAIAYSQNCPETTQTCTASYDNQALCFTSHSQIRKVGNARYRIYFQLLSTNRFQDSDTNPCGNADKLKTKSSISPSWNFNYDEDGETRALVDSERQWCEFTVLNESTDVGITGIIQYSCKLAADSITRSKYRYFRLQFTPSTITTGYPFNISSSDLVFMPSNCSAYSGSY